MKINKLLLTAASIAALSSSAAHADLMDFEQFYLKVAGGANIMKKVKLNGVKLKSKTVPVLNLAAGYSIMENVRAELEGGYVFNTKHKGSLNNANISTKPKIWTLMVGAYADVLEVQMFKMFVGAGVGTASVKDKVVVTRAARSYTVSSKRKYNFSYQLSAGASFGVYDGVTAELLYRWQEYGKSKTKNTDLEGAKAPKYKGHNIMLGLRFAI